MKTKLNNPFCALHTIIHIATEKKGLLTDKRIQELITPLINKIKSTEPLMSSNNICAVANINSSSGKQAIRSAFNTQMKMYKIPHTEAHVSKHFYCLNRHVTNFDAMGIPYDKVPFAKCT